MVGVHEAEHEGVVKRNGDSVDAISVIAQGNTLGYTRWSFNSAHSQEQNLGNAVAASFGGEAAEGLFGISYHPGSGSDRGHGRFWATMKSNIWGGSVRKILSEGLSKAKSFVNDIGRNNIGKRAWTLVKAGIIV